MRNDDGSYRFSYQGNWRDIFQNWEPLAYSFPRFIRNMITIFANGITADGYNPYRVTSEGYDWERPEPEDPWTNIGYWGDHQVIYLLKLLEAADSLQPDLLLHMLDEQLFTTPDIPYRIKPYREIMSNPYDTIIFDQEREEAVSLRCQEEGLDGQCARTRTGELSLMTLMDKLLLILLVKTTNFIPDGGIWMNTQRPEWNDANNALTGWGLSVVTLGYMYRASTFFSRLLKKADTQQFAVQTDIHLLFCQVAQVLEEFSPFADGPFPPSVRKRFADAMGAAVTGYREKIYSVGIASESRPLEKSAIMDMMNLLRRYLSATLRGSKRPDGLYHSYTIMEVSDSSDDSGTESGIDIRRLELMLEGQVSILSSGLLTSAETVVLLESLRKSPLYREDQNSYMLYPRKQVRGFFERNIIAPGLVESIPLLEIMIQQGDHSLISADRNGMYHFNGAFANEADVRKALDKAETCPLYEDRVQKDRDAVLALFETVFDHASFTGRSGSMFAYEGVGSIYWHMVSKLLLAIQEQLLHARDSGADTTILHLLAERYYDVRAGLGFCRDVLSYGAFTIDPYSHTVWGGGARQPGMTGQVKEEILTRTGELGLRFQRGRVWFDPFYLRREELTRESGEFSYYDTQQIRRHLQLPAHSLAFTWCQVPIIYTAVTDSSELASSAALAVSLRDGSIRTVVGLELPEWAVQHIIRRDGEILGISVTVPEEGFHI